MTEENNQDNAVESDVNGTEESTETTEQSEVTAETTESSDPLDAITDPEELRNKAKGYRAERNNLKTKTQKIVEETAGTSANDKPITRGEVIKQNEKKGLELAGDFIKSNKDAILPYLNTNYGGSIPDPEEIAERWKDAEAAYLRRNPRTEGDAGTELQTDSGTFGSGPANSEKKESLMGDPDETPADWFKQ